MPRYSREVARTFEVTAPLEIDLSTVNGSLSVAGQDGTHATVHARARFSAASNESADELASLVEDDIKYQDGRLWLRSPHEDNFPGFAQGFWAALSMGRKWQELEIDYEVRLPRDSNGKLRCVNGRIECSHLSGPLSASTVNGSLEIDDVPGQTKLTTVNGRIEARRYGGGEARTTNGRLLLQEPLGAVEISGVNGRTEIESAGGDVTVKCMNGPVTVSGPVRGDIDIKTMNGTILLQVPEGSSFEIDAHSEGGDVSSDLDVREENPVQGQHHVVRLRSNHGSIRVKSLEEPVTASSP
jgi:DUF4097 and DUF4098 domain-containing protein YvlB